MMRSIVLIIVSIVVVVLLYVASNLYPGNDETIRNSFTVLIYETESIDESPANHLAQHILRLQGIDAYVFGNGQGFEGYGSKYAAVYPMLKKLPSDELVVISDGRDVLLNNPSSTDKYSKTAAIEFHGAFNALTRGGNKGAIVISAEAQCCVSALTHATPGSYYNKDGTRNERACASGEDECFFKGNEFALPWEAFMKNLAIERSNESYDDVYLNAGLMAGTAKDLLRLIEQAGIGKDEDDQAVLTDYMYHHPNAIVLDYGQTLFGNNRGGLYNDALSYEDNKDSTCMFHVPEYDSNDRLHHSKTNTSPLFVHSPGGYLQCHDELVQKLGYATIVAKARRRLMGRESWGCNYSKICLRSGGGFMGLTFGQETSKFVQRFHSQN